jgi:hypothetical protein
MQNKVIQITKILVIILIPFISFAGSTPWKIGIVPAIPLNSNAYNVLWGFEVSNDVANTVNSRNLYFKLNGHFGSANALEKTTGDYTTIYGISMNRENIQDFAGARTITGVKASYAYYEIMAGLRLRILDSEALTHGIDLMIGIGYSVESFRGKLLSTENYDLGSIIEFELPIYAGYYISPVKLFEKPLFFTAGVNAILNGNNWITSPFFYWIKLGAGVIL